MSVCRLLLLLFVSSHFHFYSVLVQKIYLFCSYLILVVDMLIIVLPDFYSGKQSIKLHRSHKYLKIYSALLTEINKSTSFSLILWSTPFTALVHWPGTNWHCIPLSAGQQMALFSQCSYTLYDGGSKTVLSLCIKVEVQRSILSCVRSLFQTRRAVIENLCPWPFNLFVAQSHCSEVMMMSALDVSIGQPCTPACG